MSKFEVSAEFMKDAICMGMGENMEFIAKITSKTEYSICFDVYEILGWAPEKNMPYEAEDYLEAFMKWDGCNHFYFGDKNESGKRASYLHLCGVEGLKKHCRCLKWLHSIAKKLIAKNDIDEWED